MSIATGSIAFTRGQKVFKHCICINSFIYVSQQICDEGTIVNPFTGRRRKVSLKEVKLA